MNCYNCNKKLAPSANRCPECGATFKSKGLAIALALLLGNVGAHYFYTRHYLAGVLCILFFWTLIPAFVAIVQAIVYITMSKEQFYRHCK